MEPINILVPNHDLDSVTRNTLAEVNRHSDMRIVIAGPGEGDRGGLEAPRIKSKLSFKAIAAYRCIMRREGINMTFSPSTSGLSTMLWASVGLGVCNIGYRGTQAKVRKSDPFNFLALLNPRVHHVVCETEDITEYIGGLIGKEKVSGMCKPYELSWVDEAMKAPIKPQDIPRDAFRLIYIGMSHHRPHKGLRQLVEAMELMGDRNIHLTVIGSYDEELKAMPGASHITFLGPKPGAVAYIPGCDLYVLPSLRDASPRVLREAQACGVPCVVTDIPGARDLIVPEVTGLLVEPDSPQAIADAVCRLYDDRALLGKFSEACRPYIRDNYAFAPYVEYFVNLFRTLAKKS